MRGHSRHKSELFWPKIFLRKWLNISARESDFSADTEDEDDVDFDTETEEDDRWGRKSRFAADKGDDVQVDADDVLPRLRRRKSETFRAQYINTKELRICVGTWNVGGKIPSEDLDIDEWLDTSEPADIYVLGLQEIVPLNAGNIFGAEDSRPVLRWESIFRESLDRVRPITKLKSLTDPPSPSKFKPSDDNPDFEEDFLQGSDSDSGEEVHPFDGEFSGFEEVKDKTTLDQTILIRDGENHDSTKFPRSSSLPKNLQRQLSSPKMLNRVTENNGAHTSQQNRKLSRMLSGSERIGLSWPERPLNMLPRHVLERPNSFKSIKFFQASKSFATYNSFKSTINDAPSQIPLLADIDLESLLKRKRRSSYVRIISKQMVGIFLSMWVRRSLRKHVRNLRVSTVGVGAMGYIGNKGSVSVSMSIYQTPFCFICAHLTSGEKEGDELKRNADVHEIHRRTQFYTLSGVELPKTIHDHERIIWLGDLNYRINLSYEKTRELISKTEWSKLNGNDQLVKEFKKGRVFDGWSEGTLNFPPTYKYETNSGNYVGDDPKAGRRTPAWCDRILSHGKGLKLLSYRRTEIKLSDHRPVTATFLAEVEVFCPRRLQRALTFTDAEIEQDGVITDIDINAIY